MYSNQAIKSFKKQMVVSNNSLAFQNMKILIDMVPQAQKYYMGSDKMLETIQSIASKYNEQAFMGNTAQDVKLPFDICWFDFLDNEFFSQFDKEFKNISLKVGMFVSKANPEVAKDYPEILQVIPTFSYGPTKSWVLCGESMFIKVGDVFNISEMKELHTTLIPDIKNNPEHLSSCIKDGVKGNIVTMPTIEFNDSDYSKTWATVGKAISERAAAILNVFLMVLNCQNVVTEIKSTTKKHKKSILPKHKGVTYKILKFKLPKSSKLYEDNKQTTGMTTMPLHLCAGHPKTYTEERPLFGKVVGRWWWTSHMRGRKEHGEVKKDYHVEYV